MTPKAWTKKDERQYEHVRESEAKRGRSAKRAKEIAGRTVNKQRVREGRADASSDDAGRTKSAAATKRRDAVKTRGKAAGKGRRAAGKGATTKKAPARRRTSRRRQP